VARVLIVEDDLPQRELYREVLRAAGHEVVEARNGLEGIERLKTDPALVLLDMMMPAANGLEFLEKLRASDAHKSLPVIVISGAATEDWAVRGGANYYLTKPVDIRVLAELVNGVIRRT
jgi:two-component system chemotaxis response regulator CheY